jgi:Tol biopolymer transport system component
MFLTRTPTGIQDYVLSPDRTTMIYTVQQKEQGTELWRINLDGSNQRQLLSCPAAICKNASWSPDGQRLVYERITLPSPENPLGLPELWWLDVTSGQTEPVFPNSQWPGFNPHWSPDGQWLSYAAPVSNEIVIYNLTDGRRHTIPNQLGSNVAWQPDASAILVQDLTSNPDGFFAHLFRFDLASEQLVDLSQAANAEDTLAVWSPDGQWIAVLRRELSNPAKAEDRQLWVMRADGSEAHQLTNKANVYYGGLSWAPDSKYLLFHQYLLEQEGQPEIWLVNAETGEQQQIVSPGNWPTWLP